MIIVTRPCPGCEEVVELVAAPSQVIAFYTQGVHVQDAFPQFTPEERERMVTGYCDPCWEEYMPEEEDESDDVLMPESDFFEYDSDYYVDKDCD